MASILLPGERLGQDRLPTQSRSSKSLTIGPGLRFVHPSAIEAANAGTSWTDDRRNSVWIENNGRGRYSPAVGDQVIATVHHASMEQYHCTLAPRAPQATLGYLAFEGVTRKTRPILPAGSIVYARVSQAHKYFDPELECLQPSTGKAGGFGELKDGMLFDISLGMARRLLMSRPKVDGRVSVLEDLGERGLRFEVAVGRNGKIWVNSDSNQTTIAIGRVLQEADNNTLTADEQEKMVKHVLRSI